MRHHELVLEAATALCDLVRPRLGLAFDRARVLVGAALHDAGKIVHPREMSEPGSQHEASGERLLLEHGVGDAIARCCVTHAAWDRADVTIEDLLVALADKLWKGRRDDELEQRVAAFIARVTRREAWDVFATLDAICEEVAAEGPSRLARSTV